MIEQMAFEHIRNLAGDYKCWDSTITREESLILCRLLEELEEYRKYKNIFESHFSKEALEILSDKEEFGKWLERGRWITVRCDEINRQLEQYRALGTVDELRVTRDKQIAIKPLYNNHSRLPYRCPCCHQCLYEDSDEGQIKFEYCPECGQMLAW